MSSPAAPALTVNRRRSSRAHVLTSTSPQDNYYVEAILCRSLHLGRTPEGKDEYFYLIRWDGYDPSHDTWEPLSNLANSSQAVKEYDAKETPFSILDVRNRGTEYLVRFGIATREIEPSPYYPRVWMTVDDIKEYCRARTVDLAVKLFHRKLQDLSNPPSKRGTKPMKGSAAQRKSRGPEQTDLVVLAAGKRKQSSNNLYFCVSWREKGKAMEEWFSRHRMVSRFGDAGLNAIKVFNAQDIDPAPTEPNNLESDYDRERRRNIEENRRLMQDLGL